MPPCVADAARLRCSTRTCSTARRCRSRDNLRLSRELLERAAAADMVLEIEVGAVGGEKDGIRGPNGDRAALYTTTADLLRVAEVVGTGEHGRYLLAATFGNVHGVYAP